MIFVTVGMHSQGFDRLVKKMDEIAATFDEEVIMQIGAATFRPQHAEWFDFTTGEEIKAYCKKARLVVTHPAMSILDALEQDTPVVVVPRLKAWNEVIDDHQLDFARELEREGKVTAVYDVDSLEDVLRGTNQVTAGKVTEGRLVDWLKRYIAGLGADQAGGSKGGGS